MSKTNLIIAQLRQTVYSFKSTNVLGVFILVTIVIQCVTGIMLSFSLMTDSMLTVASRDTEDMDAVYIDDFFWLHERGVDFIFIFLILHFFKKTSQKSNSLLSESAWKSGSFMFLVIHIVIFTGLLLCCSHLSDITLKIATNVVNTLTANVGSLGYFIYTDETLNTDTIVRITYLHYILPFLLLYLSYDHLIDMHFSYRDYSYKPLRRVSFNWSNEVIKAELFYYSKWLTSFALGALWLYNDNEALSYEMFMWGDIGIMTDVRYLGVAPHWYFRPFMSFLIFCPHHYFGIAGLIYLFTILYFQPKVLRLSKYEKRALSNYQKSENSFVFLMSCWFFFLSCLYVCSFLPYGRYYTSEGGNTATTVAFMYIFIFLGCPVWDIIIYTRYCFIKAVRYLYTWYF